MPLNKPAIARNRLVRAMELVTEAYAHDPHETHHFLKEFIMSQFTSLSSAWTFLKPMINPTAAAQIQSLETQVATLQGQVPSAADQAAASDIIATANAAQTAQQTPPASGTGTTTGGAATDPTAPPAQ